MCQAIDEIFEDGKKEGRIQGVKEGRIQGVKEGRIQGAKEGRIQGAKEGRIQGERHALKRANRLANLLIAENRFDDLKRAVCDEAYQKQLFESYGL